MFDPECVILGNTAYTDMEYFKHGNRKYFYPPMYEPINANQTMATRPMNDFITLDLESHLGFHIDGFDESTIYQTDSKLKRKIARPELSLAKSFNEKVNKKLFFGAPNPLFTTEDIVLNNSLDNLQSIFHQNIEYMDKYGKIENWAVVTEPVDFMFNMRVVTTAQHKDLFKKKMMYNAAIMRKLLKIYKSVGMVCDNPHVGKTRAYVEDPNLPEFDKIYHQEEYYKKISTVLAK